MTNTEQFPRIVEDPPLPATVERMLGALTREWTKTREICLARAQELEDIARDLRERAAKLDEGIATLPDEVSGCVRFEIEARRFAQEAGR